MGEIERLKEELETQTRQAEKRLNQLQYLQADFDNYRRRSDNEKAAIVSLANEGLITELLVILDDLDLALPSLEQEKNKEGVRMIQTKLAKILSDHGLQSIDCVGEALDPYLHEAICTERCGEVPNTILQELEKGYRLKTKVIRPSKVKIAEQISKSEGESNE